MKKALREEVHKKFEGCCAYCGKEIEYKAMQVDHIIPQDNYRLMNGETLERRKEAIIQRHGYFIEMNSIDNLNPACRRCNKWKHSMTVEQFRREVSMQVERLNLRSPQYRMAKDFGFVKEYVKPVVFRFEVTL